MAWQQYSLTFRLLSPLHVGYRTVGNLRQTRGYVPGKVLWAALTARLTRDYEDGSDGRRYEEIGEKVRKHFRFTYLYPAIQTDNGCKTHYPWEEDFDYLFLNSYTSTALDYTRQAAEDAMLHEIEFIGPHTRTGRPVFLTGKVYVNDNELSTPLNKWKNALDKIQIGAKRTYGWGRLALNCCEKEGKQCSDEPCGQLLGDGRITAHLKAHNVSDLDVRGPIEPVIGWERKNGMPDNNGSHWKLSQQAIICYVPGSKVTGSDRFVIQTDGHWEKG